MSDVLSNLSESLANTVQQAGESLVRVEARRRLPASGIAWSAEGVIVTAHHVIEREENITVGLPDGQTAAATLVGRDPTTDLAVLRTSAHLVPANFAEGDTLRVGHLVLALGRPGQGVRATLGIVSALGDRWRTAVGGEVERYIQTDVVMYPGFSGGPLVSVDGRVQGLNTSALSRSASITLPYSTLRRVVETLLIHGRIRRGYIGIGVQPARLPEGLARELGQEVGLLIVSVQQGSPAEKGGLLLGDTILALAGEKMQQVDDLLAGLSGDRIGQTLSVQVVRGGQVQEVHIVVGERT